MSRNLEAVFQPDEDSGVPNLLQWCFTGYGNLTAREQASYRHDCLEAASNMKPWSQRRETTTGAISPLPGNTLSACLEWGLRLSAAAEPSSLRASCNKSLLLKVLQKGLGLAMLFFFCLRKSYPDLPRQHRPSHEGERLAPAAGDATLGKAKRNQLFKGMTPTRGAP